MTDDVHERIGFREIDQEGNAVRAVSPHVLEPADSSRHRLTLNPFILALWILDAGLAGFCFWIFSESIRPTQAINSGQGMPVSFLMFSTFPFAALTFLLLTVGLLFWHAAQWQKKRSTGLGGPDRPLQLVRRDPAA
ncbi:hypothetical protein ACIPWF_14360 [Paenarthrobacter sp. NPDC089989]|uniref:hypothetical protein n=1 Tax=unclassified Paenarthrobacter TaxID=2634190 RepID=UPI003828C897